MKALDNPKQLFPPALVKIIPRLNTQRELGMEADAWFHICAPTGVNGRPLMEWFIVELSEDASRGYGYVIHYGEHLGLREVDTQQLCDIAALYEETGDMTHWLVRDVWFQPDPLEEVVPLKVESWR